MALERILLLHTGGTLGMEGGRPSVLHPGDFEAMLREHVPQLWRMAQVRLEVLANVDSSEMGPSQWSQLSVRVHEALRSHRGVVVTHGTDTLAYTASALSFMLPGLRRPVVLTGSQRPLSEVRSDARLNLVDAVTAALHGPPEVGICFDSHLWRGNRARKRRINGYDAFESPNHPALGTLGVEVHWSPRRRPGGRSRVLPRLETDVFLLKIFPGMSPAPVRAALPGLKGLVVEGFGAGNFPLQGERSLLPLFEEAGARGIPVVMVSQASRDAVDLSLYQAGAAALKLGVIGGADMTPEAALVKLMHVLAYEDDPRSVRRAMERNLVGELTEREAGTRRR